MQQEDTRKVFVVGGDLQRIGGVRDALDKCGQFAVRVLSDSEAVFAILAEESDVDAVLAQASFPGVNSPCLLTELSEQYPAVARLSLDDAPGRKLDVALKHVRQQEPLDTLAELVERTCRVHKRIVDSSAPALVSNITSLPAAPAIYWKLTEAASDPSKNVNDLAKIVEADPVLSVRVLRLVNSAMFGSARQTSSISMAISLLGPSALKSLILVSAMLEGLKDGESSGFSTKLFRAYSLKIARLARQFLKEDRRLAEQAFTGGLLQDIGKLVLAVSDGDKFRQVLDMVNSGFGVMHKAEGEVYGADHTEVGAAMLAKWGLPFELIELVVFHHYPSRSANTSPCALAAVHCADALFGIVNCGDPESNLDRQFLQRVGLSSKVDEWRKIVEEFDAS